VYVTPTDSASARSIVEEVRGEQHDAGRSNETIHVFGDVVVFLGASKEIARARKERLDALSGSDYASDAHIFVGTPSELADLLLEWRESGLSGFRLRPGAIPDDLNEITRSLVPELQRRGAFRRAYEADTLRALLGLSRPANRYAVA
jgi:alkanesulfonate monooxygenase SsuD/methylene tetrahydromethanopterin reductase-like flavin-dependent oxidoreductase (luciferase family)